jgi:hypothetical protein
VRGAVRTEIVAGFVVDTGELHVLTCSSGIIFPRHLAASLEGAEQPQPFQQERPELVVISLRSLVEPYAVLLQGLVPL